VPFKVHPARKVQGSISFPGDKSIAHRAVIISAISEGPTIIRNFPFNQDCLATLNVFKALGVRVDMLEGGLVVRGNGLYGLKPPSKILFVEGSGTTIRLLSGLLSAQRFNSVLSGNKALSKRPMLRVTAPLRLMGADIRGISKLKDEYLPLKIKGSTLRPITYEPKIASAQVKSCILLAGLYARGKTRVIEKVKTRDHTERMLKTFKSKIKINGNKIYLQGGHELKSPGEIFIPGDISSASFFLVAALLVKDSDMILENVSINPTRAGIIKILLRMGANIRIDPLKTKNTNSFLEPVANIKVKFSRLKGTVVKENEIPALIDEIPIIMVAACFASGQTIIKRVNELRVKETDRVNSMVGNLRLMGASIYLKTRVNSKKERVEDLLINGGRVLRGAGLKSYGDHRSAMSLIIAGLAAQGETSIDEIGCVNKSFPEFFSYLKKVKIDR